MKTNIWILCLTFIIGLSGTLKAQNEQKAFSVRWMLSYNTFSMERLHQFQNRVLESYQEQNLNLYPTDNFPDYLGFTFEFYLNTADQPYGFLAEHTSTGSRLTYRDYSGRYTMDFLVSRYSLGLLSEKNIWHQNRLAFLVNLQVSLFQNRLKLKEKMTVGTQSQENSATFIGYGVGFEPDVIVRKNFDLLWVGVKIGYQFDVPIFDLKEQKTKGKLTVGNKYVNPQWQGLRIGLQTGIEF